MNQNNITRLYYSIVYVFSAIVYSTEDVCWLTRFCLQACRNAALSPWVFSSPGADAGPPIGKPGAIDEAEEVDEEGMSGLMGDGNTDDCCLRKQVDRCIVNIMS